MGITKIIDYLNVRLAPFNIGLVALGESLILKSINV
jgi:hypothetical protein